MTHGFQQQDRSNSSFLKSAPTPQHGRKPDSKAALPARPPRSVEPRPGH
ncbi:MAG TPA: hypothetical protein VGN89_14880 [Phenylobacterium sp.]|jgi:hypothetical protein|nr:hypothetical protein [Phenylobacterium sp.]